MTFSNPSTPLSRENSILLLKASLKVINLIRMIDDISFNMQASFALLIYFDCNARLWDFWSNLESLWTSQVFYDISGHDHNVSECL